MQKVDIAVVGGGVVGLSLASALTQANMSVALVNDGAISRALPEQMGLRVSAINQAHIDALTTLGAWHHVDAQRRCDFTHIHVWDKDSFGRISFDSTDTQRQALGSIVENQVLINGLAAFLHSQQQVHIENARINKILSGQQETMLMLDNDSVIACKLLVGADGAHSFIRKHYQFPMTFHDYGQLALVANVRTQQPHDMTARQVFTPTGPLALLPTFDEHICSIVWSQDTPVAEQLLQLDKAEFSNQLTAASDAILGVVQVESDIAHFPLTMQCARTWATDGVVIIGDAAHTIHPLAGQGANLGIDDAFALAKTVMQLKQSGKDFSRLRYLRPFERERKTQATKMIAAMSGFQTLFSGNDPVKKFIRGTGLVMTDKLSFIKQQWMAEASAF
ncbi:FAD-dependent monooxygenase [Alteromonas ponticola]|uniref:FAD-dependent 2-octaprenylphenol hydroxylase n=1 Tax=Alteromonas ponticola TaxID=2720613 RepID=A0ABX1R140_9ALTE|nr:FAD-dependent monooxygenase [Alteromonas ponticola]NMH59166.1 FAD-dependent 2-octaprenylphenol hydroxylase [Alteromonas ponticola]